MRAKAGALPSGPGWAYEFAYGGVRTLCLVEPDAVRLVSRGGGDLTAGYPELCELAEQVGGRRPVLDGEIVVLDDAGRPCPQRLQARERCAAPSPQLLAAAPVTYYVFDILGVYGADLTALPYHRRQDVLAALGLTGPRVRVREHFLDDGPDVLAVARRAGLSGVVAKRLTSTYRPGTRSAGWRLCACGA